MMDNSYHNVRCDACGELVEEQGKYCYELSIYRERFVKGYGPDTKMEIEPLNYDDLNLFCEKCIDEDKVTKLAINNVKDKEGICKSCKKITSRLGEVEWAVSIAKMDIEESVGCFAPLWSDNLCTYCEDCGEHKDLYVDAYRCAQEILKPEVKKNIEPYKGTFIPFELDFCGCCGSLKP